MSIYPHEWRSKHKCQQNQAYDNTSAMQAPLWLGGINDYPLAVLIDCSDMITKRFFVLMCLRHRTPGRSAFCRYDHLPPTRISVRLLRQYSLGSLGIGRVGPVQRQYIACHLMNLLLRQKSAPGNHSLSWNAEFDYAQNVVHATAV